MGNAKALASHVHAPEGDASLVAQPWARGASDDQSGDQHDTAMADAMQEHMAQRVPDLCADPELVASAPEDPDPPQTATAAAVAQPPAPQEDQSPRAGAQCVERPGVALEERRETQAYLSEGGSIKALKALDRLLDEKGEILQKIADDAQGPASGKKDTHKPREAVKDASQMPAEVIAQVRRLRPGGITDAEIQKLHEGYDHSRHLLHTRDRVIRDTGSEALAFVAVAGETINHEVLGPLGAVMEPLMQVTHQIPVAGPALKLIGECVQALEDGVNDRLTRVTGSRTFGDAVAPGLTQGVLLAVPKVVPPVVRTTGRGAAAAGSKVADLVRRVEVSVDPTVMGSGPAGVKVRLKPAPMVSEVPVSSVPAESATLNPQNVATHQRYLKDLKSAYTETRIQEAFSGALSEKL